MPTLTYLITEDDNHLTTEDGHFLITDRVFTTYSSASDVAALIPNILNGASTFENLTFITTPGSLQFFTFMEEGYSRINTKLKSQGYTIPISPCAIIRNQINDIEASYAAYKAELARSSPRSAVNKRTLKQRNSWTKGLQRLMEFDLTRTNIEYDGKWEVAGIDRFEKAIIANDKDRVSSRFQREQLSKNLAGKDKI